MKKFNVYEAYNAKGEYQGYFLEHELETAKSVCPDWTFKKAQRIWG